MPGPFTGRTECHGQIVAGLRAAIGLGAREMWWVAPDFCDWPVESEALLSDLGRWARSGRSGLHWVADDFDRLRRHRPRLVAWRQRYAHVLSCRRPDAVAAADLPTLLLVDDRWLLRVNDPLRWRGRVSTDHADLRRAREQVDALLQRSEETFPVTTLGI